MIEKNAATPPPPPSLAGEHSVLRAIVQQRGGGAMPLLHLYHQAGIVQDSHAMQLSTGSWLAAIS